MIFENQGNQKPNQCIICQQVFVCSVLKGKENHSQIDMLRLLFLVVL